ncbi:hypothetical protein D3C78_988790 [compost metagenome]
MAGSTSLSGLSWSIWRSNWAIWATRCCNLAKLSEGVSRNRIELRSAFSGTMPLARR